MGRFVGIGWLLAGVVVALVTYLLPNGSPLRPLGFFVTVALMVIYVVVVIRESKKSSRTPRT
jgi:FtsH-binding integral membrane protein